MQTKQFEFWIKNMPRQISSKVKFLAVVLSFCGFYCLIITFTKQPKLQKMTYHFHFENPTNNDFRKNKIFLPSFPKNVSTSFRLLLGRVDGSSRSFKLSTMFPHIIYAKFFDCVSHDNFDSRSNNSVSPDISESTK